MFKTRLISGILLAVAAAAVIYYGNAVLPAVLLITSLVGYYEFLRVFDMQRTGAALFAYGVTVLYYVLLYTGRERMADESLLLLLSCLLLIAMAYGVFCYPHYKIEQMTALIFGMMYVPVMLSYIYRIRILSSGLFAVGLVFLGSWGCDTCAYCVGMLVGRHKLAPVLSPKKSIEGAIGGIAGSALLTALYMVFVGGRWFELSGTVWMYALLGAALGIVSQVGDLFASAIKRQKGVKDYGRLIPGHGGILDRFDSVIVAACICFYLYRMVEQLSFA